MKRWAAAPVVLPGVRTRRWVLVALAAAAVVLLLLIVARPQDEGPSAAEIRLRAKEQMDRIERRVREIEAKAKASPAPSRAPARPSE